MLKHRLRSGFALTGALLAALFIVPSEGVLALLAPAVLVVTCGLALNEFYALLRAGDIPHLRWTGVIGGLTLLVATALNQVYGSGSAVAGELEVIILFAIAAVAITLQMFKPTMDQAIQSIACTLLGVVYIAWMLNFLNKLLLVFGHQEGRMLILYLVVVVKMTDVGAFFIGCKLGGKKFFPKISPAKTWSGVLGGMVTGLLCSVIAWYFWGDQLHNLQLVDAIVLGVMLSAMGIWGDLIESLIKRASGAKDSGTMIQGMGGLLDILDSLIFTAPFLYIYIRLFMDVSV